MTLGIITTVIILRSSNRGKQNSTISGNDIDTSPNPPTIQTIYNTISEEDIVNDLTTHRTTSEQTWRNIPDSTISDIRETMALLTSQTILVTSDGTTISAIHSTNHATTTILTSTATSMTHKVSETYSATTRSTVVMMKQDTSTAVPVAVETSMESISLVTSENIPVSSRDTVASITDSTSQVIPATAIKTDPAEVLLSSQAPLSTLGTTVVSTTSAASQNKPVSVENTTVNRIHSTNQAGRAVMETITSSKMHCTSQTMSATIGNPGTDIIRPINQEIFTNEETNTASVTYTTGKAIPVTITSGLINSAVTVSSIISASTFIKDKTGLTISTKSVRTTEFLGTDPSIDLMNFITPTIRNSLSILDTTMNTAINPSNPLSTSRASSLREYHPAPTLFFIQKNP